MRRDEKHMQHIKYERGKLQIRLFEAQSMYYVKLHV